MTARLARTIAWCAWHRDLADDVALIQPAPEPTTEPGGALYACRRCRETYRLTPWEDRP
ncbi:hypothetical protein AB0904_27605 [Streptomyces sp. NPDC006684]|uniref:hypothetical protein n=1 Tax=Streptomyces sp. NPDC006684 TaxID=3154477 RepID=UPI003451724F